MHAHFLIPLTHIKDDNDAEGYENTGRLLSTIYKSTVHSYYPKTLLQCKVSWYSRSSSAHTHQDERSTWDSGKNTKNTRFRGNVIS